MKSLNTFVSLCVLGALAGCMVVHDARVAQRRVAPKGAGETGDVAHVDLRGHALADLIGYAMTNRPSLKAAQLAVTDARLALKAVDADAPLVSSVPWNAADLSVRGGYSESSVPDNSLRGHTDGGFSGSVSLDVLVYDFGRHAAAASAAAERVVAAELECVRTGYEVFCEVSEAYFAVYESDALLEAAATNVDMMAAHLERDKELLEEGEANQLDVLRARLDLAKAREALVAASNRTVTAGAELMRALGVEATRGSRADVIAFPTNALAFVMSGFAETRDTAADVFAFARTNAPAMKVARARLRASSHAVDAAVADLMPSLSASAQLSFTDPLWAWNWGVSAVQSLFQGFRKTTAVERAVVAMESAASEVDRVEQELSLAVEQAVAARDNATAARRAAGDSIRAARENLDLVKERFDVGEASRVDFTDAVSDYVTALGNWVSAFYGGQCAEVRLLTLTGAEATTHESRKEKGEVNK